MPMPTADEWLRLSLAEFRRDRAMSKQTTTDLEQQVAMLQDQIKTLARALNEAMRTPALREYFSEMGDYGPLYHQDPTYNAVYGIAWPDEGCIIVEDD